MCIHLLGFVEGGGEVEVYKVGRGRDGGREMDRGRENGTEP